MKVQSICTHEIDMSDGAGGRRRVMPGDVFEVSEEQGAKLVNARQAIDLAAPAPKMTVVYVGPAAARWVELIGRSMDRDVPAEVPLWVGLLLLDREPGNWKRG